MTVKEAIYENKFDCNDILGLDLFYRGKSNVISFEVVISHRLTCVDYQNIKALEMKSAKHIQKKKTIERLFGMFTIFYITKKKFVIMTKDDPPMTQLNDVNKTRDLFTPSI